MTSKFIIVYSLVHLANFCICYLGTGSNADGTDNIFLDCEPTQATPDPNQTTSEFAHMVLLGIKKSSKDDIRWVCSGVPLNEKYILTVAHCVLASLGPVGWVRTAHGTPKAENVSVDQIFVHPDYKSPFFYNDIALIKLSKALKFGRDIKSGCLNAQRELPTDSALIATSWSRSDFADISVNTYKFTKSEVKNIDSEGCKKKFSNSLRRLPGGIKSETQICTEEIDSSACQSIISGGGSLTTKKSFTQQAKVDILGIASFGKAFCGSDVFTRIYPYIPWIKDTVKSSP